MTFLAPAWHDRVEAPWLIEGPINGESGHLSIDRALVPPLRPAPSSRRTTEINEINETTDSGGAIPEIRRECLSFRARAAGKGFPTSGGEGRQIDHQRIWKTS